MRGVSVTQKFQLGELVLSTGKEANGPATVTSTFSNRHPGSHVEWSWSEKEDMATKESGAGFFGQRSASGRLVADSAQTRRVARLIIHAYNDDSFAGKVYCRAPAGRFHLEMPAIWQAPLRRNGQTRAV